MRIKSRPKRRIHLYDVEPMTEPDPKLYALFNSPQLNRRHSKKARMSATAQERAQKALADYNSPGEKWGTKSSGGKLYKKTQRRSRRSRRARKSRRARQAF